MEKYKMSRLSRASQFLPFDALKGLQEALRLKEYENERVVKGELTLDKAKESTQEFLKIKKRDVVKVTFYSKDNHYHNPLDPKACVSCDKNCAANQCDKTTGKCTQCNDKFYPNASFDNIKQN